MMTNGNPVPISTPIRSASSIRLASISIVAGGALWGLFWVPVRMFEDMGFTGAWPGLVIYLSALALIAPFAVAMKPPAASLWRLASVGLFTGAAFSFYSTAIILTDVLRAILFFYLTPVWGTIIGVLFLGERLTIARVIAIASAFGGLFAVVGFGSRSALNLGDILALASGVAWAIGSYKIYKLGRTPAVHLSVAFLCGSIFVTVALMLLGGKAIGPYPVFPSFQTLWPYALLSGLFAVPMILLTVYPTSVLTPGRIGILLMSEIVVGIASVALLAGEPFGPYEALGSALILAASLIEVAGDRTSSAAT